MTRLLVSMQFAPFGATPALAARHGQTVVDRDCNWHEAFGPGCFLLGGRGAGIGIGHNGRKIGEVVVTASHGKWWTADCVIESDDPQVLERIKVGAAVSVGFDNIASDDNLHTHVRQHTVVKLKHIAILRRGEIPAFVGAKIVSVSESKSKARASSNPGSRMNPILATGGRMTGAEGWAELYRRLEQDDVEWSDAYMAIVDRVDATGNWWLPPSAAYLDRGNAAARRAA